VVVVELGFVLAVLKHSSMAHRAPATRTNLVRSVYWKPVYYLFEDHLDDV
jgi:hypothetical protein